jgi:hypothetical protein
LKTRADDTDKGLSRSYALVVGCALEVENGAVADELCRLYDENLRASPVPTTVEAQGAA